MMNINISNVSSLTSLNYIAKFDNLKVLCHKAFIYNMFMKLINSKQPILLNKLCDSHLKCSG